MMSHVQGMPTCGLCSSKVRQEPTDRRQRQQMGSDGAAAIPHRAPERSDSRKGLLGMLQGAEPADLARQRMQQHILA